MAPRECKKRSFGVGKSKAGGQRPGRGWGAARNWAPLLVAFLCSSPALVRCQDTDFAFSTFVKSSVIGVGNATVHGGAIVVASVTIQNEYDTDGRALYPNPVQLRNSTTKTLASFATSFTFSVDTQVSPDYLPSRPSGMAFIVVPDTVSIGYGGGYLGLINGTNDGYLQNHIFGIEVDTAQTNFSGYQDVSGCHLGVDIITLNSKPVFDMCPAGNPDCNCIENKGIQTLNISYDGVSHLLIADLFDVMNTNIAHVSTTVDLYPVFNDMMYVGFSAAGLYMQPQQYTIHSWQFASTFSAPPAPPASAPVAGPGSASAPGPTSRPAAAPPAGSATTPPGSGNCTGESTTCSPPSAATKSNNVLVYGAGAGAAGGLLLLLGLICGCACVGRNGKGGGDGFGQDPAIPGGVAVVGPRRFTYKELSAATKNFNSSELLGKGGSGSVYRGVFRGTGAIVAVKVIQAERSREMAEKEFQAEVSIINQIRHRNLVQLQGWCNEKGMLCLVYEYLPNGSLDSLLRKELQAPNTVLPWGTRFNILTGVAAALAYLHEEIGQCILHRDLKPGNVLLDANYNACLADFGLARLIDHDQVAPTTMLAGTMGYMAPELPHTGRATTQSDVYSFGILIIEMVCGRRPTDVDRETQMPLLDCVWAAHQATDILCIADPKLMRDHIAADDDKDPIARVLQIGLLCCHPDPDARPSMRSVRQILTGDSPLPPVPREKPVVRYSYYSQYGPYAAIDVTTPSSAASTFSAQAQSLLK